LFSCRHYPDRNQEILAFQVLQDCSIIRQSVFVVIDIFGQHIGRMNYILFNSGELSSGIFE